MLKLLKAGDEAAFTELYKQYHRGIYAYLLDFVKVPELAEDITHEVFMKIWEIRERLHIHTSFSVYLYRISHNKAIDVLKKIAADKMLREEVLAWLNLHGRNASAGRTTHHYEQLYLEAIAALPPQRQKVFILCREQGKTYDEAALELGISRNTVKEHMVHSIRFLRNFLAKKGALTFLMITGILL